MNPNTPSILPQGITGFYIAEDTPPPTLPLHDFKALAHHIAQHTNAAINHIDEHRYRSYYEATITIDDTQLAILCNHHYPYTALTTTPGDLNHQFTDNQPIVAAIETHPPFRFLSPRLLATRRHQLDLSQLSPTEQQQIKQQSPTNLGQIIFNHWD